MDIERKNNAFENGHKTNDEPWTHAHHKRGTKHNKLMTNRIAFVEKR